MKHKNNPNEAMYQSLISDDEWYTLHRGQYIAIVDGNSVGIGSDEMSVLEAILDRYRIPQEPNDTQGTTLIYFKKVMR